MRSRDGLRGKVGEGFVTPTHFFAIGRGIALYVRNRRLSGPVVVGRDPRPSSPLLANMLISGLLSEGVEVVDLGVLPTPGVSCCIAQHSAAFGVMITGSHNKFDANGLKVFDHKRCKVSDDVWDEFFSLTKHSWSVPKVFHTQKFVNGCKLYADSIRNNWDVDLTFPKVVLDCAYGACGALQKEFAQSFLWESVSGGMINNGVGALYPMFLQEKVCSTGADVGIAFDGDGDRILVCTSTGRLLDGQDILALLVGYELDPCVVVSKLTNRGLVEFFKKNGVRVCISEVGDAAVAEMMRQEGAVLGAEPSGHVLLKGSHVGDAFCVMTRIIGLMQRTGQALDDLVVDWTPYPSRTCSVACRPSFNLEDGAIQKMTADLQEQYASYNIIVRRSKTEPLVRIYVEGKSQAVVTKIAGQLFTRVQDLIRGNIT